MRDGEAAIPGEEPLTPDGGRLELEVDPVDEEEERAQDAREDEERAEQKRRRRQGPRARKPGRARRPGPTASSSGTDDVEDVLRDDPELAKVYEQFTGKVGSAKDLAGLYAMLFAPIGFCVHEAFELHDAEGNPTAECLQLARGTWPAFKKYAPGWLAWLRENSPQVLAIASVSFFLSRKAPIVVQLAMDPSQLRINRIRAAAAEAVRQEQQQQRSGAASQVVDINSNSAKQGVA